MPEEQEQLHLKMVTLVQFQLFQQLHLLVVEVVIDIIQVVELQVVLVVEVEVVLLVQVQLIQLQEEQEIHLL